MQCSDCLEWKGLIGLLFLCMYIVKYIMYYSWSQIKVPVYHLS